MTARRFGGSHSPGMGGQPAPVQPAAPVRTSWRARALYIAALPMLLAGIREIIAGDAFGMVVELGSFALLAGAAVLVNEGLRAEAAWAARAVARRPAIPRKLFGAIAAGLGVGLGAAFGWGIGIVPGVVFGLAACGAALIAYGLDPMADKGMAGVDKFENDRVAEAVEKAERLIADMTDAARRFGDRALEGRVTRFADSARTMFRAVESDPRDLTRARKYLGVYLMGARDATVKFADVYARNRDTAARADYEALLTDLETGFAARQTELLQEDRGALDVEIEVLRKRLKQDGLG